MTARLLSAFIAGLIFGLGLVIAGMINPVKVQNFLDVAGSWDPSLAFVMGGALTVTAIGYRVVLRRASPLFEPGFLLPTLRKPDLRLLGGAALFGVGWGLAGFCPGPAIAAAGAGVTEVYIFLAAMLAGMAGWRWIMR